MVGQPSGSESELQQLHKLEMLGLISASIAHNFNNQLTSIVSNVDDVFEEAGDNLRVQAALAQIRQSAQQAGELCRQLVSYSRPEDNEPVVVDFSKVIVDLAGLMVLCLPKNVALQIACEPDLPPVLGNLNQVRQVLINLMINAGSAMRDTGGTVLLRTGVMQVTTEMLATIPQQPESGAGNYVFLEVADTGPGMDAASVEQLYEPFLTPDECGKGLGLAVVLAIARVHGGFVQVQSAPGQGLSAQVFWPVLAAEIPMEPPPAQDAPPAETPVATEPTATRTVLLIDDDAMILASCGKLLEKIGFAVVTATDGVMGVEKFLVHRDEISCIILDLNMPYMNGAETLKSLREAGCQTPVIIASGFSRLLITQEMRDLGISAFLEKPFSMDTLSRTLEKVFNPSGSLFL